MRNAMEVVTEMDNWWHSSSGVARTTANAVQVGITWLYNRTYSDYTKLEQESSKIAHFRQLFTVWKAVALRWKSLPFYDEHYPLLKAFPEYLERTHPDLFPVLLANRVFLGLTFTPEETARHEQLKRAFTGTKFQTREHQRQASQLVRKYAR